MHLEVFRKNLTEIYNYICAEYKIRKTSDTAQTINFTDTHFNNFFVEDKKFNEIYEKYKNL